VREGVAVVARGDIAAKEKNVQSVKAGANAKKPNIADDANAKKPNIADDTNAKKHADAAEKSINIIYMPQNTRAYRCVHKLKKKYGLSGAIGICQKATKQSYMTGRTLKKKRRKKRRRRRTRRHRTRKKRHRRRRSTSKYR